MRIARRRIGALLLVSALLAGQAAAAQLPNLSRPIGPDEVRAIYAGKTWSWKERPTGIYFAPSGAIQAFENAPDARVGTGRWRVDDKGRLCVDIRWRHLAGGSSRHRSCWSHRRVGSVIWKQNGARSEWYSLYGHSREAGRINEGNRIGAVIGARSNR